MKLITLTIILLFIIIFNAFSTIMTYDEIPSYKILASGDLFNIRFDEFMNWLNSKYIDGTDNIKSQGILIDNLEDGIFATEADVSLKFADTTISITKAAADWFTTNYPLYVDTEGINIRVDTEYIYNNNGILDFTDTTTLYFTKIDSFAIDPVSVIADSYVKNYEEDTISGNFNIVGILTSDTVICDTLQLGKSSVILNSNGDTVNITGNIYQIGNYRGDTILAENGIQIGPSNCYMTYDGDTLKVSSNIESTNITASKTTSTNIYGSAGAFSNTAEIGVVPNKITLTGADGSISTNGNITGNLFYGDGSNLSGIGGAVVGVATDTTLSLTSDSNATGVGSIVMRVANKIYMTLFQSGDSIPKVGINIGNPTHTFEVYGSVRIYDSMLVEGLGIFSNSVRITDTLSISGVNVGETLDDFDTRVNNLESDSITRTEVNDSLALKVNIADNITDTAEWSNVENAPDFITADSTLSTVKGIIETIGFEFGITAGETHYIDIYANYNYYIDSMTAVTDVGECTVTLTIDETAITGLNEVGITDTISTNNATANKTVVEGNKVQIAINSITNSATILYGNIRIRRY